VNAMEKSAAKHRRRNGLITESGHFYSNETGIWRDYMSAILTSTLI